MAVSKKYLFENEKFENTSLATILYFYAAMLVISAMTWLMSFCMAFGEKGIFLISIIYAMVFALAGVKLWKKARLRTLGGLFITMSVCMIPIAIYALETYLNISQEVFTNNYSPFYSITDSRWIRMELGTILAGLIAFWFYRFPLLTAPVFYASWYLSMDITSLMIGHTGSIYQKSWVSLTFGIFILLISYVIDLKKMPQYGFWGYLFGTFLFWGSLTILYFKNWGDVMFLYLIINLLMMILSTLLKRKVLSVFGAIGIFFYFSYLSIIFFPFLIPFPFNLPFLGLFVLILTAFCLSNSEWIGKQILDLFPQRVCKFFPFGIE